MLIIDFILSCLDDVNEAYNLVKDLDPTTPQEYILKGVVNAALGQEQGSVIMLLKIFYVNYDKHMIINLIMAFMY